MQRLQEVKARLDNLKQGNQTDTMNIITKEITTRPYLYKQKQVYSFDEMIRLANLIHQQVVRYRDKFHQYVSFSIHQTMKKHLSIGHSASSRLITQLTRWTYSHHSVWISQFNPRLPVRHVSFFRAIRLMQDAVTMHLGIGWNVITTSVLVPQPKCIANGLIHEKVMSLSLKFNIL